MNGDSGAESETTPEKNSIRAAEFPEGGEVETGWRPNRRCRLRHTGGGRWAVVSVENSTTLRMGDTFVCQEITAGEVLYASELTRDGQVIGAVRLGIDHGISKVVQIP